jgi:ABC-type bacteriocin/lantibiotic exporter with double-glycine peptidase domain
VYAANQAGLSAYLHRFSDVGIAADLIQRGIPVICSIATDYPIDRSPNYTSPSHLLILAGINGDHVTVYDPAASRADQVKRHYDRGEFMTAWFNHGGLGIIIFE